MRVAKLLVDLAEQRNREDANERLELELKEEMREAKGQAPRDALAETLDEFAKCDEFSFMDDMVSGMLTRQADSAALNNDMKNVRQKRITKTH